ncbi:MAG: hypothetical protein WAK33_15070 [Silvibacterium sp.]|jgi:hypothetical protein
MNPRLEPTNQNYDQRIDQALRRLGSVEPAAGIEDRISARLAQEHSKARSGKATGTRFFAVPHYPARFALTAIAAGLACFAIVAGSVNHSRRIQPTVPGISLHQTSSGMGTAGAAHPANQPVTPPPSGRPRSVRQLPEGRAVISPETQKANGVAVPKTPSRAQ